MVGDDPVFDVATGKQAGMFAYECFLVDLVAYGHSDREAGEAWVKMWFDRQSEPSPPSPTSQPESDAPQP